MRRHPILSEFNDMVQWKKLSFLEESLQLGCGENWNPFDTEIAYHCQIL